jgi:hypothetical protein
MDWLGAENPRKASRARLQRTKTKTAKLAVFENNNKTTVGSYTVAMAVTVRFSITNVLIV